MNTFSKYALSATAGLLLSASAAAHERFILPSHNALSGDLPQSVSFVASVTNDFFHPDFPLGNNGGGKVSPFLAKVLEYTNSQIILPNGEVDDDMQWLAMARMSVADYEFEQDGTYRIALYQKPTPWITYTDKDGKWGRLVGDVDVPAGATDVSKGLISARTEAYVTVNKPNQEAVKPSGYGLEVIGSVLPNELFVGETVDFQLFLNGEKLEQENELTITLGETRYRNQRDEMTVKTDAKGRFEIEFEKPGRYLLHVENTQDNEKGSEYDYTYHSLFLTLDVFPE
ncbi:MAG: DUF4198 domain-containing protein [Pseudomonadota bacterium]|nr:DUF4198 domain-containing protein [Pseudomonadota bacterium]